MKLPQSLHLEPSSWFTYTDSWKTWQCFSRISRVWAPSVTLIWHWAAYFQRPPFYPTLPARSDALLAGADARNALLLPSMSKKRWVASSFDGCCRILTLICLCFSCRLRPALLLSPRDLSLTDSWILCNCHLIFQAAPANCCAPSQTLRSLASESFHYLLGLFITTVRLLLPP